MVSFSFVKHSVALDERKMKRILVATTILCHNGLCMPEQHIGAVFEAHIEILGLAQVLRGLMRFCCFVTSGEHVYSHIVQIKIKDENEQTCRHKTIEEIYTY